MRKALVLTMRAGGGASTLESVESAPSRTAMISAVTRGWFRITETPPSVLDDALALVLTGPAWRDIQEQLDQLLPGQIGREAARRSVFGAGWPRTG